MWYFLLLFFGFIAGAVCVYAVFESRLAEVEKHKRRTAQLAGEVEQTRLANEAKTNELALREWDLSQRSTAFESKFVSFEDLRNENGLLKRDLRNIDVELRKHRLDGEQSRGARDMLDEKVEEVGRRYLKDSLKWIESGLNQNNYANCKQRLVDVLERCRGMGLKVAKSDEVQYFADLKMEFERLVRAALEREEQSRIKAKIREDQQREAEAKAELDRLKREQAVIQAALQRALAETHDQHSAEVERLKTMLAEAEEKSRRAISQAQLTKAGHVYVISNIGSFGDHVYKIGMTRRLEPVDRVSELSDASVPFPFDVHMMISSTDAPSLENTLHRAFHSRRVNKVNPRKEFFKVEIEEICRIVKEQHGEVQYIADAEALEYRQSLTISDEDQEFIEKLYDDAEDEPAVPDSAR